MRERLRKVADLTRGMRVVFLGEEPEIVANVEQPPEQGPRLSLPALERIRPGFSRDWIRRSWVFRASYAQPVPALGMSARLPGLATPIPGLYLASMSQVYPWDRGTNYAVEIGRRAARELMAASPAG